MNLPKARFFLRRGETFFRQLRWLADGVPVDLTGYTFTAELPTDALTLPFDITIDLPLPLTDGYINLSMTAAETEQLTAQDIYRTDLRYVEPGGDVKYLISIEIHMESPVSDGP
jgi:hypothetical protein